MGEVLDSHVSLQRQEVLQADTSDNDMDSSSDVENDNEDDIVISDFCSSYSSESESDPKETNSGKVPVVVQFSGQTRSGRNIVRSFNHHCKFFRIS